MVSLIPERGSKACADRYKGNYNSKNCTSKNQFVVMSDTQLTN
jgi:hypothetical protein